jgi:DNA-binding transcriptional LysR family regulator
MCEVSGDEAGARYRHNCVLARAFLVRAEQPHERHRENYVTVRDSRPIEYLPDAIKKIYRARVALLVDSHMTFYGQLLGRLRFKHFALLVALDQHRNLHRAAEAIHLAQPSATKLVHDLELVFGFPLFERQPRGMQPTELGAEVLAFARRTLADLERFTEDLENKRQGGYGQLVIGAIMGAAPDVVAHAMADLKQRRPLLSVKLLGETSDEIINLLLAGKIDLAVGRFSNPLQHNDIDYEVLGNEVLCMVVRKDHPLSRVRRLSLPQLEGSPWILQPLTSPARQIIEQEFGEAGMKSPANTVESTSIFATLQLLQKSDAVTMLPESVVRDHLRAGLLSRLSLKVGKSLPGFGILSRRGEPLNPAATEFVQSLRHYRRQLELHPAGQDRRKRQPAK